MNSALEILEQRSIEIIWLHFCQKNLVIAHHAHHSPLIDYHYYHRQDNMINFSFKSSGALTMISLRKSNMMKITLPGNE